MKRKFTTFFVLFSLALTAAADIQAPKSITLQSGDVMIRLDKNKCFTINRIEFQNRQLGVDSLGAQYGTVFNIASLKGPVGSGHQETGNREHVKSLKINVDGKPADFLKANKFTGKNIRVEKVSTFCDFTAKSTITLAGRTLIETVESTCSKTTKLSHLYHFMHPWKTTFTEMFYTETDGKEKRYTFKSDNKFTFYRFVPAIALYNPASGDAVVTVTARDKNAGQHSLYRLVWDRKAYRKDYIADFFKKDYPAGRKAYYSVTTRFFNQKDPAAWINDAKAVIKELTKTQNNNKK